MAFSGSSLCTSFKVEILKAIHDFTASTGDTFKLALYNNSATFTAATTAYTATNEVAASGTGANPYVAGGGTLVSATPVADGTTAICDFADITFTAVTITAYGALIYNTTPTSGTNPTVCVLDFGGAKTSTAGDFTITFPAASAAAAIIRIA
jgi:hypothetical protein